MLGKIVIILLIAALFYMILAGKCSSVQNYMPYLPTKRMCDMTPEYWPEVCPKYSMADARLGPPVGYEMRGAAMVPAGSEEELEEALMDAEYPKKTREHCCGASPASTNFHLKLLTSPKSIEKCCGMI